MDSIEWPDLSLRHKLRMDPQSRLQTGGKFRVLVKHRSVRRQSVQQAKVSNTAGKRQVSKAKETQVQQIKVGKAFTQDRNLTESGSEMTPVVSDHNETGNTRENKENSKT